MSIELTEVQLMRQMQSGSEAAFDTLYRRYFPRIRLFISKVIGDPEAAKDLAQETFLVFWKRRTHWTETVPPLAILYGIAIRKCKQHFRKTKRDDAKLKAYGNHIAHSQEPEAELVFINEIYVLLHQLLGKIPGQRGEILRLYAQGHKIREIAEMLGKDSNVTKAQKYKALQELIRLFEQHLPGNDINNLLIGILLYIGWSVHFFL